MGFPTAFPISHAFPWDFPLGFPLDFPWDIPWDFPWDLPWDFPLESPWIPISSSPSYALQPPPIGTERFFCSEQSGPDFLEWTMENAREWSSKDQDDQLGGPRHQKSQFCGRPVATGYKIVASCGNWAMSCGNWAPSCGNWVPPCGIWVPSCGNWAPSCGTWHLGIP